MSAAPTEVRTLAGLAVRVRALEAQLAQSHREMASLTREDAETGLAHRRELDRLLQAEVARSNRYGRSLAVVLVELSGAEGDVGALAIAATAIVGSIRVTDQATRYSARCFAVVLPETDDGGAQVVGARLHSAIRRALGDSVSARVGTSSIPEDGQTVDALLRAAREALSSDGSHLAPVGSRCSGARLASVSTLSPLPSFRRRPCPLCSSRPPRSRSSSSRCSRV